MARFPETDLDLNDSCVYFAAPEGATGFPTRLLGYTTGDLTSKLLIMCKLLLSKQIRRRYRP